MSVTVKDRPVTARPKVIVTVWRLARPEVMPLCEKAMPFLPAPRPPMLVTLGTVRLVESRASVPAGVLENVAVTGVPEPLVTVAVATVDWTFPTWVRAVMADVPQVILYG